MKSSAKYLFVIICFGLTACASGGQKLNLTPVSPIIVYEQGEIQKTVMNSKGIHGIKEGEIFLNDVPGFNISRSLKTYRPNRAYAIGHPSECGGSWHAWNRDSADNAAIAALQGCLQYVRDREIHTGKKCGARLVMVNKKLLVRPDELNNGYRVPFVMQIESAESEEDLFFGMFQYEGIGESLPLMVFNDKGKKVCDGSYSLSTMQAVFGAGEFEMNCFDGQLTGNGSLSVKNVDLNNISGKAPVGIGKGTTSGGSKFNFLTGITINNFEQYEYLLK